MKRYSEGRDGENKARSRGVAHSLGKIVSYLTEDWDELKVQQRVRLKTTGPRHVTKQRSRAHSPKWRYDEILKRARFKVHVFILPHTRRLVLN